MKELFKPQTLKDIKQFSSIKMGVYIPRTGKRTITQFDILPNSVFYREDVFTPKLNKNFKKVTKMGHLTQKQMCDVVNRVLQSSNDRIKGVFAYTGGVTLHGQKVTPNGSTLFEDMPTIPNKLKSLLDLKELF